MIRQLHWNCHPSLVFSNFIIHIYGLKLLWDIRKLSHQLKILFLVLNRVGISLG